MRREQGASSAILASLVELEHQGRGGTGMTATGPKSPGGPQVSATVSEVVAAMRLRVGSIWRKGDRTAIVVEVKPGWAWMRTVAGGKLGRRSRVRTWRSAPDGYRFEMQQPTLTCVDEKSAEAAVAFLRSKGIADHCAFACGRIVVVSMTPGSVMRFADDAFEAGWAHDEDCARMMGDLG